MSQRKQKPYIKALKNFWNDYKKHKMGLVGIALLIFFTGMAIFAPWLAPDNPSPVARVGPPLEAPVWTSGFDPHYFPTQNMVANPTFENNGAGWTVGLTGDAARFTTTSWETLPNGTYFHMVFNDYNNTLGTSSTTSIYLKTSFNWAHITPAQVNMSISYRVKLEGSYTSDQFVTSGFKITTYLVGPNGHAIDPRGHDYAMLFQSSAPYVYEWGIRKYITNVLQTPWLFNGIDEQHPATFDYVIAINITGNTDPSMRGSITVDVDYSDITFWGYYHGLLGTTETGGDVASQLIFGSRISLTVGILATALSTFVGLVVGLVSGYYGGMIDEISMRIVDFLMVIPGLPLMMVLTVYLGRSVQTIIVVIAILGWTGTSRIIRSQVLAERHKAYVESALAIGASDTYIIFRHILPNVTPILFANVTLGVVAAILTESGLAFLGLTDPYIPSWGLMLSAGSKGGGAFLAGAWWLVIFPGLAITLLSMSFTFIGHTLDTILNPRLKRR